MKKVGSGPHLDGGLACVCVGGGSGRQGGVPVERHLCSTNLS